MTTALIADDSIFFRSIIKKSLEEIDIKVISQVRDGKDAVHKAKTLKPDLIFLDLIMPRMDGITALVEIMKNSPTKVIIMTAYGHDYADVAIRALEKGAIDFFLKDSTGQDIVKEIQNKAQKCLKVNIVDNKLFKKKNLYRTVEKSKNKKIKPKLVIIGSSTGGPKVLREIFQNLRPPQPPIILIQHLPKDFADSFTKRLNDLTELNVILAQNDMRLANNTVYVAPGGTHLTLKEVNNNIKFHLFDGERVNGVIPSLDPTILSASYYFDKKLLIVILTGMGFDGLAGSRYAKTKSSTIIAQNEESCLIFGMPKAIIDENLADYTLPPDQITKLLNNSNILGV
jgi:two-component system chemotaxis response regulator CheB